MRNLVYITGGWGYGNRGDNAILAGMLQSIEESGLVERDKLLITSYEAAETKKHNNVDAIDSIHKILTKKHLANIWHRFALWLWQKSNHKLLISKSLNKHIELMKASKVLIMGGGGYFNDDWPDMLMSKYAEIELAAYAGCPVVMYGQTIGPFSDATIKESLSTMLESVSAIAYRDTQSINVLAKCNYSKEKSQLTADEANLLKVKDTGLFTEHAGKIVIGLMIQNFRPHLGVSGETGSNRIKNNNQYISEISDALNQIIKDISCHLVFIPSTEWDVKSNKKVFENIAINGKSSKTYLDNLPTSTFIESCQQVDLMVSTNMHPVILAATASKPSVAISYHYKLDDYMNSIGQQEYVLRIDNFTVVELVAKVNAAIANRLSMKTEIAQKHISVKNLASKNFELIEKFLK